MQLAATPALGIPVVAMVLTEIKAVRAMLEAMKDKPGVNEAKTGQAARLLNLILRSKLSIEEVPSLLSEVAACGFDERACGDLNRAISERAGRTAAPRKKLQDFTSIANYFPRGSGIQ